MKPRIIPKSLSAAVLPLILFALVAVFIAGCGKKDAPRKEEPKVEAHEDAHHPGEKAEEADTVELSPEKVKASGIEVQKVVSGAFDTPLAATAVIEPNGDRVSRIGARVAGRIARVTAVQGDRVKAGQSLAYLESVELDQAWSEYAKVKGRQTLAATNLRREETLFEKKVTPEKDVLKARQELSEVEADLALAAKKLRLLGVGESQLGSPSDAVRNNHLLIAIPSPLSGVVVEKSVTQGEMVGSDKVLFTVSDLSTLWLVIDIYEHDLGRVKSGMQARLSISAYPGKEFRGKISYIADVMDDKTRTVKARVTVDNRDGFLKPGMFATASIDAVKALGSKKVIAVPEEAVFLDGSERHVFVQVGDGRFVARQVSVGLASGTRIEIKEGLKDGDAVVIRGVFALKSELKKESLDVHEH